MEQRFGLGRCSYRSPQGLPGILAELSKANELTQCDLKPLVPQTPDSPQPLPKEDMLCLARLWAAECRYYELCDRSDQALQCAMGILKMGWDWNQGPICYRLLGAEIVNIGGQCLARILTPNQPRPLLKTSCNDIQKWAESRYPYDIESYATEIEPYEPLAFFGSEILRMRLRKDIGEAFVAAQVARAQTEILKTQAAILLYHYDLKVYPERLDSMIPTYIPTLPQDPFRQNPLTYLPQGQIPRIYSWGPDGLDNYGGVPYNPTRGLSSSGDIYFSS